MTAADRTTMTFRPLADEQILKFHLASLELLERTGVSVQEPRARSLLLDAGASDAGGDRVRIPSWMVKQALAAAPERVVLHGRDGRRAMPMEASNVFFGTGSDTPNTIDPDTRQRRRAVKDDVRRIARLCDALGNIDFVMSMGIPSDVPTASSYVHEFDGMLAGTAKPIVFTAHDNRDMQAIHEMAVVVAGSARALRDRPFLLLYAEPISPLQHTRMGTEKLLFCADKGIPCVYVSGIMAGGNAPVTLAGAIALANAEVLSGLVISQLAAPGAPFIYGANVSVMDMRTCGYSYGAPEFSLTNSIFAAMAHHYRLPVWGLAGAADAKTLDAQAAAEATFSILTAVLSGGNLVHDIGYLESGLTSCMEMILFGDEVIAMCRRLTRGVELDEDSFAADVIDAVGPGGGFIDTDHTLDNFRSAHWLPRFMDRRHWEAWDADGRPPMPDRLNAEVKAILARHTAPPLADDQRSEIDKILSAHESDSGQG